MPTHPPPALTFLVLWQWTCLGLEICALKLWLSLVTEKKRVSWDIGGGRRILAISFGSTPEPKIQDHSQLTVLKEFLTCPLEIVDLALKRGTSYPGWICSPHNTEPLASWCLLIVYTLHWKEELWAYDNRDTIPFYHQCVNKDLNLKNIRSHWNWVPALPQSYNHWKLWSLARGDWRGIWTGWFFWQTLQEETERSSPSLTHFIFSQVPQS